MFKKLTLLLFSFEGRLSRARFWLGVAILWSACTAAAGTYVASGMDEGGLVWFPLAALFFYCNLALLTKRFHDLSEPTQAQLAAWSQTIVLIGWALVAIVSFKGANGPNRYGPDPL